MKTEENLKCEKLSATEYLVATCLALYVLTRSKRPVKEVVNDFYRIESLAGVWVGRALHLKQTAQSLPADLKGSLASVFLMCRFRRAPRGRKNP